MTVEALQAHGVEEMDDDQVREFLATQDVAVLGLPDGETPYFVPLSYGYDGADRLYFTFVLGSDSRKAALSDGADGASVLVYTVDTPFAWQSVHLSGSIEAVPEDEWSDVEAVFESAWQPDLFETAKAVESVRIYAFEISAATGIKHTGLPPALGDE